MMANRATESFQGSVKELKIKIVNLSEASGESTQDHIWLQTVSFDKGGNKIEEANYQSGNSLASKIVYVYDSTGKLIEQLFYGASELPYSKMIFEYDSENRLTVRRTFD